MYQLTGLDRLTCVNKEEHRKEIGRLLVRWIVGSINPRPEHDIEDIL